MIDDEKWKTAQYRLAVIGPYLNADNPTRELANELARDAGVHPATFYRWVERYRQADHLSGLVPDNPGRNKGHTRLAAELEEIINDAIERIYLTRDRKPPGEVIHEIRKMCRRAGIDPPHDNTIRNRIGLIPERVCLKKRGYRERAANKFEPIKGSTKPGSYPLEFTQIDHTPFDAIVVDEEHRLPLGRPWVTMQIDVLTRVVTGAVLTLEAPSAVSVALCVSRSILPKTEYLDQLGVEGDWPVWGQPGVIQSDNAKEFYSQALTKACEAYAIDLQYRPRGRPQYGGHIERLLGVTMKEFQKLPGTTFSNIREREGYDSDKEAVFTLRELERQFIDWIVNVYLKRLHSKLEMPPLKKWEIELMGEGEGRPAGLPAVPADPERLYIDFLPYGERTVQRYGIQWDKVNYYKECLNPWINAADPDNPKALWEFKGGSGTAGPTPAEANSGSFFEDCNLGLTYSTPIIVKR
ncbi:MAG: Mu transposase C-terminal domain-containing protein, partial [Wenzhouxiangellaceae bacterium]